jgi:hypothetical protein
MSPKPLFLYGEGRHGESHGEEKEEIKIEDLKRAQAFAQIN